MANWTMRPLAAGAVLLEARERDRLEMLGRERMLELLTGFGVVLMRGFRVELETFCQLVERVSTRTTLDPLRPLVNGRVQLVDRGNQSIPLHCENGNCPWRPDLLWLYCRRPAANGGETTICDGSRVWQNLKEQTRAVFRQRDILYRRPYPARSWRAYLPHLLPTGAEISLDGLIDLLDHTAGVSYRLNQNQTVFLEYRCHAVGPSKFSGEQAFANSIHGPYPGQVVTLAERRPIPANVLRDIAATTTRLTETIPWRAGDVAIIDNTRFLHGRNAFSDQGREVFAALSFA